jgi:hypothetical protein
MEDQGTKLWTLVKDGREVAAQVRLVPYGIEVDILHDGQAVITRTFDNDGEALAWADQKRMARASDGWAPARESTE